VPGALEAAVVGDVAVAERGEQVPAAVRDRERLALADPDREGAVRSVLDDTDLRVAEVGDGDQALGGSGIGSD
jgi:hypothetical protein